jgi:hypothetical protein
MIPSKSANAASVIGIWKSTGEGVSELSQEIPSGPHLRPQRPGRWQLVSSRRLQLPRLLALGALDLP